jgi:hypothetical protein
LTKSNIVEFNKIDFLTIKKFIMKKKNTILVILLPLIIIFSMTGCQKKSVFTQSLNEEIATASHKGPVKRAFHDSFSVQFRFIPDIAHGWVYPMSQLAWWPGSGSGNATHMGKMSVYVNSYTLRNAEGVVVAYHSPVNTFFASELAPLGVPADVSGVLFDDKGNSIWMKITTAGLPSTVISPTRINLDGPMLIVGGTGKFAGASGESTFQGYFNPTNLNEATFWADGWIAY